MDAQTGSRFLSSREVEGCIRKASPIFHVLLVGGPIPPEIVSPYDDLDSGPTLEGFALRPPTIFDGVQDASFSSRVYSAWLEEGVVPYRGVALPGITFVEATGAFRLDSLGPSYPGDFFLDEAGLTQALRSLAAVATREAVKQHLTEGGDERLHISPKTGGNKYFCPPHPVHDMVLRGSCTCSPPSQIAFDAACKRLDDLWADKMTFKDASGDLRSRISNALGIQTPHHVILHPSGTDAEYTPLVIGANHARRLSCTGIVNIIVGAGEVGSNTAKAAGGSNFSAILPSGRTEFDTKLSADFERGVQVIELKARSPDGSIVDNFEQLVVSTLEEVSTQQERPYFIVHAVDGSKLGSHITSQSLITQIQHQYGERVLPVLDACQARTERDDLDWYLSRNGVVLITASKFYGAPGFCALALVPDSVASHLKEGAVVPSGLSDYLTKHDVPSELEALREALTQEQGNVGLHLRWTCGVAEMERFAKQGAQARHAINLWVESAKQLVFARSPYLEVLEDPSAIDGKQPTQIGGVNSIISFRLRTHGDGDWFKTDSLKKIHQWMTKDVSALLPSSASSEERRLAAFKCFTGQPVDLGSFAILRIAVSNALACAIAEDMAKFDFFLEQDAKILDKIVVCLTNFDAMDNKFQ